MASITMTASFLGSVTTSDRPSVNRRRLIVAKAVKAEGTEIEKLNCTNKDSSKNNNTRRDVMFAAAAAAVSSIVGGVGIATATTVEPKRGTPEAKKIYAPVCVTMPTARICHK